jgi:hypothetical protein
MKTSIKTAPREPEMINDQDSTPNLTFISTDGSRKLSRPFKSTIERYDATVNHRMRVEYVNPTSDFKSNLENQEVQAKFVDPKNPVKSILLRKNNDASILRGATRVREQIMENTYKGNLLQSKSIDSDEWSNPWGEVLLNESKPVIQDLYQGKPSELDKIYNPVDRICAPNWEDVKVIHSALTVRDENIFEKSNLNLTLSCTSGESSARKSMYMLPSLIDDNDSTEVSHSTLSLPSNRCLSTIFTRPSLCEENVPPAAKFSPSRQAPPQSPTPSDDGTHITTMGRGNSLKLKIVTYNVQSLQQMDDDETHDESCGSNFEDMSFSPDQSSSSSEALQSLPNPNIMVRLPSLSSPIKKSFHLLQNDVAFCHAQSAGHLWQSLVGQHVRFPKSWFNGLRSPPMGADSPWRYIARLAVYNNPILNRLVRARYCAGRILLHFLVKDFMTGLAIFDLAIGCFHPNAKGIRNTKRPDPNQENSRHVWMAIRKVNETACLLDNVLCRGSKIQDIARDSPLGNHRREVTNHNMRSIFGELPPVQSICIPESDLYEKITSTAEKSPFVAKAPALLLLREFLIVPI